MTKRNSILLVLLLVISSCVSPKVYKELEGKYSNLKKENRKLESENDELTKQKNLLLDDLNTLSKQYDKVLAQRDKIQTELVRRHLEFDKEKGTMKKAPTTDYLKNYDKIVITDDKKKNIYYKKIQQILINNFKINMNELIQFQFNI